jgi:hypothetical protein
MNSRQIEDFVRRELEMSEIRCNDRYGSLKELFTTTTDLNSRAVQMALATSDKAIEKQALATEERFKSVNEFRAALSDNQRIFMPRAEYEIVHKQMELKIEQVQEAIIVLNGTKQGQNQQWIYIIGTLSFISLLSTIVLHFVK